MTDTSTVQIGAPLGVGAIISDSFSILFKKFISVILLALIPTLVGFGSVGAIYGFGFVIGTEGPSVSSQNGVWIAIVVLQIAGIVITSVSTALLVQLAYDAKLNRPITLGEYISPAIKSIIPVTILSILMGILVAIAAMALVIPGLWALAVFYVVVPAVVLERAGFSGLSRSAALTKEYRWPIVGLFILLAIIGGLIGGAITYFAATLAQSLGTMTVFLILMVMNAILSGLGAIAIALTYARLREIKEGVSVDQLANVFD